MSDGYTLRQLNSEIDDILAVSSDHRTIIDAARPLLEKLLKQPDLIPEAYRKPHPHKYAQYLLYKPDNEAFSVIAFIWGPKQTAPVHDHLVWGLVGLYEGAVQEKRYRRIDHGKGAEPRFEVRELSEVTARKGDISFVYPPDYDIHGVSNPFDEVAITVHIYGTDIGKQVRNIHDPETGQMRDVITRHDNDIPLYS
ncbi:cysteine dioxygenase family protein [Paenibacillus sinopodophylli]|uniref:cysteine dioxygenase family protein n=1 Tax=Paenibacillus sinopodophylli TaxID=1837342 RepID=UPI00110CB75B|nr:cysteine dioxygenase family protein [Paenibacillus sinopodophylli]